MSLLAAIRPDEWSLPLFVHVLGAMVLVGGLLTSASATALARGDTRLLRTGYFTLLAAALPGFLAMRIGAQWIYGEQGWEDVPDEPLWLAIGWITGDLGGLLLLVALICGGVGVRRLRRERGTALLNVTLAITLLLLALYVVAAWAMTAKPG